MDAFTAAHRSFSFGTIVEVTNLANDRQIRVRINDRGPYVPGRILDLSYGAAKELRMIHRGTSLVSVKVFGAVEKLLASRVAAATPLTANHGCPEQIHPAREPFQIHVATVYRLQHGQIIYGSVRDLWRERRPRRQTSLERFV
jgi:rare lipoprotein A (peptidoglycan hydrolase)